MSGRTKAILYWVFTGLFSAFMLFSAFTELAQIDQAKELLRHLGYPLYLNEILGVAKVLGLIAILQPRFTTVKEWAYAGFTIDIVGASVSNGVVDGFAAGLL